MGSFHDKFRNNVISIFVLPQYPHGIVWICLLYGYKVFFHTFQP